MITLYLLYRTDKRLIGRDYLPFLALDWAKRIRVDAFVRLEPAPGPSHLAVGLAKLNPRETVRRW